MYELFTNMSMYIYILGPVTGSLLAPQWAGTSLESVRCWERRTGSCLMLALYSVRYIDCLLPYTQAYLFHELPLNDTQWNMGKKKAEICLKYS